MASAKFINERIREIADDPRLFSELKGSDQSFITHLIKAQDASGNRKLTARQKNIIKNILRHSGVGEEVES